MERHRKNTLFHTGLRISEFCGLTMSDIDLKNREIHIDHQLQRTSDMEYIIVNSPKTDAGNRTLPMDENVYECFRKIVENRKPTGEKTGMPINTGFATI